MQIWLLLLPMFNLHNYGTDLVLEHSPFLSFPILLFKSSSFFSPIWSIHLFLLPFISCIWIFSWIPPWYTWLDVSQSHMQVIHQIFFNYPHVEHLNCEWVVRIDWTWGEEAEVPWESCHECVPFFFVFAFDLCHKFNYTVV